MSAEDNNKIKHDELTIPFIQEKIIPKKKGKIKKIIVSVTSTAILAILFGFVGRLVFNSSDSFACKILGQNENQKVITFPTVSPSDSETDESKNQENNGVNSTDNNEDTSKSDIEALSQKGITKENDTTVTEPKTVIIKQNVQANLNDYNNMYSLLSDIVNEANKSIVTVSGVVSGVDWFYNTYETTNETSGVIIANNEKELIILTSKDKIVDANNITVTFPTNFTVSAKIKDSDTDTGLAVVAVDLSDIPENILTKTSVATLGESYSIALGDPVIALGSPNGYTYSMGLGIITNKINYVYVTDNKLELFNTDIEDNPNSEGIIIGLDGDVVGIITQKYKKDLNENISTVLGISKAKPIIERLVNQEKRVYFGIIGADLTTQSAKNLEVNAGIYVSEVEADSPAFEAGLQSGDVILQIDNTVISTVTVFNNVISSYQPNDSIRVKIKRTSAKSSKEKTINVILEKKGKK